MPFQTTFKNKLFTYNLGYRRPKWWTSAFEISFCYEATWLRFWYISEGQNDLVLLSSLFFLIHHPPGFWPPFEVFSGDTWWMGEVKKLDIVKKNIKSTLNSGNLGVCAACSPPFWAQEGCRNSKLFNNVSHYPVLSSVWMWLLYP